MTIELEPALVGGILEPLEMGVQAQDSLLRVELHRFFEIGEAG